MPFVNCVFPAPKSPVNISTSPALRSAPHFSPRATVSAAEDDTNVPKPVLEGRESLPGWLVESLLDGPTGDSFGRLSEGLLMNGPPGSVLATVLPASFYLAFPRPVRFCPARGCPVIHLWDGCAATRREAAGHPSRAAPTQDGRWLPPDETLATRQSARSGTGDRAETLRPSRYAGYTETQSYPGTQSHRARWREPDCAGTGHTPVIPAHFLFLVETGYHHVGQAGLELLTSGHPPALSRRTPGQSTGARAYLEVCPRRFRFDGHGALPCPHPSTAIIGSDHTAHAMISRPRPASSVQTASRHTTS